MKFFRIPLAAIPVLLMCCIKAQAANFGGPDAVENTIADDAASIPSMVEERLLEPWFKWKQELQDDTGFSFGLDYTPVYLKSNADGFSGRGQSLQRDVACLWCLGPGGAGHAEYRCLCLEGRAPS